MNYKLFFSTFFLTSFILIGMAKAQAIVPLKVLSLNFNSEDVMNDSNEKIRDLRFHGIIDWIQDNSPDIILLQEAWNYHGDPSVALTLAKAAGYDVAYRLDMGFPALFYDSDAVLTKKELHMSHEKDLKLPHSAIEKGDGKTWVVELGSVSYAVGVQTTLSNGDRLFIYSTHLLGSSESDRKDQLMAIDQDLQKQMLAENLDWNHTHVMIGGDFNADPTEAGPTSLIKNNYSDSFNEAHPGDPSCSFCGDPAVPYFNPTAIGAALFPSQNDESYSSRGDYLFYKSQKLKTLSSSLIFTLPWEGVWMTDHYGVYTILGDMNDATIPTPAHDHAETPAPVVLAVTDQMMLCDSSRMKCTNSLPSQQILGARGLVIQNQASIEIGISIQGPGMIMTDPHAGIYSGESAAFSFSQKGNFTYQISISNPNDGQKNLKGKIQVLESGY